MNYKQVMIKQDQNHKCEGCHKLSKQLKIATSDYDFEIKKMQEDKSTEKALFQINMMKEIRKLNQKLQKEKNDHESDNKSWMSKYDESLKENHANIQEVKQKSKKQMEIFMTSKNREIEQFKKNKIDFFENKIKQSAQDYLVEKTKIQETHQNIVKEIQTRHINRLQKLQKSYKEQTKKKSDSYQATILGLKSQLKAEENLHLKTKEQHKNIQSNLLQEIYSQKKNAYELQEKIRKSNEKITEKQLEIQTLNQKIQQNQKLFEQNLQKLKDFYTNKEEQQRIKVENQIKMIYKKQFEDCDKYETTLIRINEQRQNEVKMYNLNIQSIKSCIEDRPSRLEDIEEIIQLREKLYKKQKQCDNLHEELRWHRLELQNKQDIYNKIFGPNNNNQNNHMGKKKQPKLKRAGRSVTTVRQILNTMNSNHLAPLAAIDKIEKKNFPPRNTKIL